MDSAMINFSYQPERRKYNRRFSDQDTDDLYKTFSTHNCHSCIERGGESILLLNTERKLLYATMQMKFFLKKYPQLLTLDPQFSLSDKQSNYLVQDYFDNKENARSLIIPLSLRENNIKFFFTYHRLPTPSRFRPNIAQFLIKVRGESRYSDQDWNYFAEQFSLTQAEVKLCRAIIDGWTLKKTATAFNISIHTIRSQLSSIFSKTYTERQSDLLRLIHLTIQS